MTYESIADPDVRKLLRATFKGLCHDEVPPMLRGASVAFSTAVRY